MPSLSNLFQRWVLLSNKLEEHTKSNAYRTSCFCFHRVHAEILQTHKTITTLINQMFLISGIEKSLKVSIRYFYKSWKLKSNNH